MEEDKRVERKSIKKYKQGPWYWLSDTKGEKSITATLVFVSFVVTTLAYLVSTVEKVSGVDIRAFDVAACSTYFVPILTLYFGRKWTESKATNKTSNDVAPLE